MEDTLPAANQPIDPNALRGVLDQPTTTVWSGATVGPNESFDRVWLRLTATEPGICRIAAQPTAIESGLCTPAIPARSPILVDGDSLAYFTLRRLPDDGDQRRWELGATGHGPTGARLAERLNDQVRAWDADRTATPMVIAYPVGTPHQPADTAMTAMTAMTAIIDKPCVQLTVTYRAVRAIESAGIPMRSDESEMPGRCPSPFGPRQRSMWISARVDPARFEAPDFAGIGRQVGLEGRTGPGRWPGDWRPPGSSAGWRGHPRWAVTGPGTRSRGARLGSRPAPDSALSGST